MTTEVPAPEGGEHREEGATREPQAFAAVGAAVGGLVAVLGTLVFTGTLQRLPRNNPVQASLAFAAVIVAAG